MLLGLLTAPTATARPVFDTGGTSVDLQYQSDAPYIALGDVDEDGVLDLASLARYGVDIRIGTGNGGFREASPVLAYSHFTKNQRVVLCDLDDDGHLDVLLASNGMPEWARGDGAGSFGPFQFTAQLQLSTHDARPVAVAALNANGTPDLVLGSSSWLRIYADAGTSSPDSLGLYDTPCDDAVAIGDFDENGTTDVVTTTQGIGWSWLSGNGNGTLQSAVPVGPGGRTLFVADLDRDGHLDVACGGTLYRGLGNGSFATQGSLGFDPAAVVDLDGDNWPDVVRLLESGAEVRFGNGPFSFGSPETWVTGYATFDVQIGDLNLDGRLDLVIGCGSSHVATVLLGIAPRGFRTPPVFPTGTRPVAIVSGEFTGDGVPDVATVNAGDRSITVLPGLGDGRFSAPVAYAALSGSMALLAADLDGDGRDDLVSAADSAGAVSVFRGLAGGGFAPRVDHTVGGGPSRLALGDWDGDGLADLAVADRGAARLVWMKGDGVAGFGAPIALANQHAFEVAMFDENHDGRMDIAFQKNEATRFDTDVVILRGDGAGGISGSSSFGSYGVRAWYAVGDVTSDGWPDLAVATRGDSLASVRSWLWIPGTSGFPDSIAPSVTGIRLADVDGDGHLDALTTSDHANSVTVRYGRGDGTFGSRHDHVAGDGVADLAVADFDGDGDLDVAVANARGNNVTVLENHTASAPTAVEASLVSADAEPGRVRLVWFVPDGGEATVERHDGEAWSALTIGHPDGTRYLRYDDDAAAPGQRYGYRLARTDSGGEISYSAESWVDVPGGLSLALHGAHPNPARGTLQVSFALPDDRPSTIEVWDVAGRRLAANRVESLGAGAHSIALRTSTWAPGVYLIRLVRGTESRQARIAVIR